ncbi:hypothetical protein K0M31_014566, partial [Melipona bicolor]
GIPARDYSSGKARGRGSLPTLIDPFRSRSFSGTLVVAIDPAIAIVPWIPLGLISKNTEGRGTLEEERARLARELKGNQIFEEQKRENPPREASESRLTRGGWKGG